MAIVPLQVRFPQLGGQPGGPPPRRFVILNWLLLGLIVLAALLQIIVAIAPNVSATAIRKSMPVGAVEFISQTQPDGPMFNSYNWGGYLMWKLYPDYRVYVDGRTDLYDDEFFNEFILVYSANTGWQKALDARGINLIIVERDSKLAIAVSQDPHWRLAYSDPVAVVYLRNR
jgi:hypothetical protein